MAGRGREAVLPSWMTSNGIEAANSFNPQVSSFPSEQYHGDSAPLDAPSAPREERDRGRDRDRDRDRYCYIILLMIISSCICISICFKGIEVLKIWSEQKPR